MLVGREGFISYIKDLTLSKQPLEERTRAEIGLSIGRYRRIKGLSYARLAKTMRVSVSTVIKWERGRIRPNQKNRLDLDRLMRDISKSDGTSVGESRVPQSIPAPRKNSLSTQTIDLIKHSIDKKQIELTEIEKLKKERKKLDNRIRAAKARKNNWARAAKERRQELGPNSKNLFKYRKGKVSEQTEAN